MAAGEWRVRHRNKELEDEEYMVSSSGHMIYKLSVAGVEWVTPTKVRTAARVLGSKDSSLLDRHWHYADYWHQTSGA